ncbi:MAG TPA: enoyl-CoA hydratase/isomerase family protein [Myxococcota bacterium]
MSHPTLSPAHLVDALADPAASERFSVLTGQALVCVDLAGAEGSATPALAASTAQRLGELPALSVGFGAAESPSAHALAPALDVRLGADDAGELAAIEESAAKSPLASLGLAQLLRASLARTIYEGLVAESLVYSTLQAGPEFAAWLGSHVRKQREPSREPAVLVARDGAELSLRLNRPEKRNAFSAAMRDALCEALRFALHEPEIARIELSGAGAAFCSGGDLDEFGTLPDPATAHAIRSTRNAALLLSQCAARVRSRVHGVCVGAGIELPAFGRRVVAREDARFSLPEVGMGLVPGAGGTVSLPRRIGRQRTAQLALTRRAIGAERALAWGLVDEIAR